MVEQRSPFRSEEHRCLGCGLGTPIADPEIVLPLYQGETDDRRAAERSLCSEERWIGRYETWDISGRPKWWPNGMSGALLRVCSDCQERTVTTCRGCSKAPSFRVASDAGWWFAFPFAIRSFTDHRYDGDALCNTCLGAGTPAEHDESVCGCGIWEPNVGGKFYDACWECALRSNFGAW